MLQEIIIDGESIQKNWLYSLHKLYKQGQDYYTKVFYDEVVKDNGMIEILDYNSEVLEENFQNLIFQESFLPILKTQSHKQGFLFIIPIYECRLNDYLFSKGNLEEKKVMSIVQDIIKATYGLIVQGYYHRCIRIDNFVLHKGHWKMDSLVLNQSNNLNGQHSEYLWSNQYKPPQEYQKRTFPQIELDQKIVWDIGNIIIDLLTGSHKLKNLRIMNQFKGEQFTFQKLNITSLNISIDLKKMLSKMCHYDGLKRMRAFQLFSSGFFSKDVAQKFKENPEHRKFIYAPGMSSVSKAFTHNSKDQIQSSIPMKQIKNGIKKQQQAMNQFGDENNSTLKNKKDLKIMIERLKNKAEDIMISKQQQIVLEQFKNYFNKGEILIYSQLQLKKALELGDQKQIEPIYNVTKYALSYVRTVDLQILADSMNDNEELQFFDTESQQWLKFHGSQEYHIIQKYTNYKLTDSLAKLAEIKQEIMRNQFKNLKGWSPKAKWFITNAIPTEDDFSSIKYPYRQILRKSYDLVADHYRTHKTQKWASIGMYLTYCLAVDKIFLKKDIQLNFKYYRQWAKDNKLEGLALSLDNFQKYLKNADKELLLLNSVYIIEKYFQVT